MSWKRCAAHSVFPQHNSSVRCHLVFKNSLHCFQPILAINPADANAPIGFGEPVKQYADSD
jgi:hypothetical protein